MIISNYFLYLKGNVASTMKKFFYLILALAAVLPSASCKKDKIENNADYSVVTGQVDVGSAGITLNGSYYSSADDELVSVGFEISENFSNTNADVIFCVAEMKDDFNFFKALPIDSYFSDFRGKQLQARAYVSLKKQGDKKGKPKSFRVPAVKVTSVSLSPSLVLTENNTQNLSATIEPSDATDKTVIWTVSGTDVIKLTGTGLTVALKALKPGKATVTVKTNDGGFSGSCAVVVRSVCPSDAVDLGLSVYWAKYNLGASSEYADGNLYAWGEPDPRTNLTGGIAIYNSSTDSWVSRYQSGNVLLPQDDPALKAKGGRWRVPTLADYQELVANCTTSSVNNGSVYAVKFTSKKNGASIIIPHSYYYYGPSDIKAGGHDQSSAIFLWLSTWSSTTKNARTTWIKDGGTIDCDYISRTPREYLEPVRPVSD